MVRALGVCGLVAVLCFFANSVSTNSDIPQSERSKKVFDKQTRNLTQQLHTKGLKFGAPLYIRIFKEEAILEVWLENKGIFELFKSYDICRFSGSLGPKTRQGDRQAPEGFYYVGANQLNPWSRYHLSFNLGYPNSYDRAHGYTGSALMVHGNCVSIGCYAMTDKGIEEIYTMAQAALSEGQPFFRVHIFPFKMTPNNMKKHRRSAWIDFWRNLQAGYAWFEEHRRPPNVTVVNRRYRFEHDQ